MGEAQFEESALVVAVRAAIEEQVEQATQLRVSTPGGRFQDYANLGIHARTPSRWQVWIQTRNFP